MCDKSPQPRRRWHEACDKVLLAIVEGPDGENLRWRVVVAYMHAIVMQYVLLSELFIFGNLNYTTSYYYYVWVDSNAYYYCIVRAREHTRTLC